MEQTAEVFFINLILIKGGTQYFFLHGRQRSGKNTGFGMAHVLFSTEETYFLVFNENHVCKHLVRSEYSINNAYAQQ